MTFIPDATILIHQSVAIARAVIFGFKLIDILRKLLFFALQEHITAEELLLQIKQKFPGFEFSWRGYSYIRLFPFPFMEVVFVYFSPGSYTGIHCHDFVPHSKKQHSYYCDPCYKEQRDIKDIDNELKKF